MPIEHVREVIVFDLDDTLYLERDYAASGFRAVGRWMEARRGVAGFGDAAARHFAEGRRVGIFDTVLTEFGIAPSPSLIRCLVDVYRRHPPEIELAPDALHFLGQRREGVAFALLTDGFLVSQRNKIGALGLRERGLFPLICTDVWGRDFWKPHARSFEHVQSCFDCQPAAFTYVADNPEKDFLAPQQLGWRTVQISRPERVRAGSQVRSACHADRQIESLIELG